MGRKQIEMCSLKLAGDEVWQCGMYEKLQVLCRTWNCGWEVTSRSACKIESGEYVLDYKRGPLLVVNNHEVKFCER